MKSTIHSFVLSLSLLIAAGTASLASASDHDDGEMDLKGRNLNLTDLYVFREDWQDSSADPKNPNLILVMNSNPRSVARQQYYFSTEALYEFHLSRVTDVTNPPTAANDITLRVTFDAPDRTGHQRMHMSATIDGRDYGDDGDGDWDDFTTARTTTLADAARGRMNISNKRIAGGIITAFAGLREDPFFFDVEQYFRVRAGIAQGPKHFASVPGFRSPERSVDFATGYNVNTLVLRVPIRLLEGGRKTTAFDVWETISVPTRDLRVLSGEGALTQFINKIYGYLVHGYQEFFGEERAKGYLQVERLARPAINEGLVISNDNLNAFNAIPPSLDATSKPVAEAAATLGLLNAYGKFAGLTPPAVADTAAGFIPDVMRIDTTAPIKVGGWAYNGAAQVVQTSTHSKTAFILTGGRKLEDDVMDITLSYLLDGVAGIGCGPSQSCAVVDNVSYSGGISDCAQAEKGNQGENPANSGHRCLHGQSVRNGTASYPFLANPN